MLKPRKHIKRHRQVPQIRPLRDEAIAKGLILPKIGRGLSPQELLEKGFPIAASYARNFPLARRAKGIDVPELMM